MAQIPNRLTDSQVTKKPGKVTLLFQTEETSLSLKLQHYTDDDEKLIRVLFEVRKLLRIPSRQADSIRERQLSQLINVYHIIDSRLSSDPYT
ncbi:hypothetical protein [Xanthocytophaga flava]|uniref:hypothetical protein n=1 Tax=Xanthocytophaga flava TaxID=3048013 RepID=UPI0028CFF9D7|nr:hypothetical protein [Xanthocytophaga flavus]MDJ1468190.1 hypothetical protein [Xanthocytophaga flavus]